MKVSTESMSASASSSLAAAAAAAMTTPDCLATRFADGAAASPPRRWLFPENGECVGACDEDEEVEGRKVGDARTWSIAAPARGALFFFIGWRLVGVCVMCLCVMIWAGRRRRDRNAPAIAPVFFRLVSGPAVICGWEGRREGLGVWARVVAAVRARTGEATKGM